MLFGSGNFSFIFNFFCDNCFCFICSCVFVKNTKERATHHSFRNRWWSHLLSKENYSLKTQSLWTKQSWDRLYNFVKHRVKDSNTLRSGNVRDWLIFWLWKLGITARARWVLIGWISEVWLWKRVVQSLFPFHNTLLTAHWSRLSMSLLLYHTSTGVQVQLCLRAQVIRGSHCHSASLYVAQVW